MAQILVRNLDESVVDRLKKRATLNSRSLQSEVKLILEQASRLDAESASHRFYTGGHSLARLLLSQLAGPSRLTHLQIWSIALLLHYSFLVSSFHCVNVSFRQATKAVLERLYQRLQFNHTGSPDYSSNHSSIGNRNTQ